MKPVKIILLQDISTLGNKNEVKSVAFGYAKNWLIPQKLAALATPLLINQLQKTILVREEKMKKEDERLQALIKQLDGFILRLIPKKTAKGTLYAGIDANIIAKKLKEKGIIIDEKHLQLDEPIKKIGEYNVPIIFSKDFQSNIKIVVK